MRLFRAFTAATCAIVLAVGCRDLLGIREFDAGEDGAPSDAATDAPDAVCEASIDVDSGVLDDVVQLALGNGFSCALQSGGDVWCWGLNDQGQLGPNAGATSFKPVLVMQNATRIGAGNDFACAQTTASTVRCWGNNDVLQLGRPDDAAVDKVDVPDQPFKALSVSHEHGCLLGGTSVSYCWGANDQLQSGQMPASDAGQIPKTTMQTPTSSTIVATGAHHTCLVADDTVYCFGLNDVGQFGQTPSATPATILKSTATFGPGIIDLQANATDTCALLDSGVVKCSGTNSANEIASIDSSTPIQIAIFDPDSGASSTFMAFSIADEHSCFVTTNGNVACTGAQSQGQLGNDAIVDGSSEYANFVHAIDGGARLDGVIGVAVTGVTMSGSQGFSMKQQFHSCAIVRSGCGASGRVACWGANAHGQLGIGNEGGPGPIPAWVVAP